MKLRFLFCVAVAVISLLFFICFNHHLDEFIFLKPLATLKENAALNQFASGYLAYEKIIWGPIKFGLAFIYVGIIQAILFYPFYSLFDLFVAKYLYSTASLLVFYWLMSKSLGLKARDQFKLLYFFPLLFVFIFDSGPINISAIGFPLTSILFVHYFNASDTKKINLIFLMFILYSFLAFFDKVFYLFLFPSILIFSLAEVNKLNFSVRKFVKIGLGITVFATLVLIYLFTDQTFKVFNQEPVFTYQAKTITFLNAGENEILSFVGAKIIPQLNNHEYFFALKEFVKFLLEKITILINNLDFPFYLNRQLELYPFYIPSWKSISILPLILFSSIFLAFVTSVYKFIQAKNRTLASIDYYLLSFFAMFGVFFLVGKVFAIHHFVFLWIPIAAIYFKSNKNSPLTWILNGYLFISLCLLSFNLINHRIPQKYISVSYPEIRTYTHYNHKNRPIIINFDSWNYYYLRLLDNPNNDIITWVHPAEKIQLVRMAALAKKMKCSMLLVTGKYDWNNYNQNLSIPQKVAVYRQYFKTHRKIYHSDNIEIHLFE